MSIHISTARRRLIIDASGGKCENCDVIKKVFLFHKRDLEMDKVVGSTKLFESEKKNIMVLCKSCGLLYKYRLKRGRNPGHGEYSYYTNYRCRCVLCKKANQLQCRAAYRARSIDEDLKNIFYEAGKLHHKECFCGDDKVCKNWFDNSDSVKQIKGRFRIIS